MPPKGKGGAASKAKKTEGEDTSEKEVKTFIKCYTLQSQNQGVEVLPLPFPPISGAVAEGTGAFARIVVRARTAAAVPRRARHPPCRWRLAAAQIHPQVGGPLFTPPHMRALTDALSTSGYARLLTLALDLLMSHAIAFERFELKSLAILLLLVRASRTSSAHALYAFDPGPVGTANPVIALALGAIPRSHIFEVWFVALVWHYPFLLEALVVALALEAFATIAAFALVAQVVVVAIGHLALAPAPLLRTSFAAVRDAGVPRGVGR